MRLAQQSHPRGVDVIIQVGDVRGVTLGVFQRGSVRCKALNFNFDVGVMIPVRFIKDTCECRRFN